MKLAQMLRESFLNVLRNKLRTGLTMLGLIIGIASVIVLVGIGDGSNQQVAARIQSLGGNIISAYTYNGGDFEYKDIENMRLRPDIKSITPSKSVSADVSANHKKLSRASVTGTDEQYLESRNLSLIEGRNLSVVDRENKSKVCLVGEQIAQGVCGSTHAVGHTVKINGDIFTIVGVIRSQGESMGLNTENLVAIPFSAATELGAGETFNEAYVKATSSDTVNQAKSQVESYLSTEKKLGVTSFSVNTQDELLNAGTSVNETMTALLGGIASISLIVAGIGVMNVMLVSVAERVREIGIKKALGARKMDIMGQFLTEALIISIMGGACGIVGGLAFGYAAVQTGLAFEPSINIVAIAAGTSIAIGLVFGLVPSYRAASLNLIEALR